MVMRSVNLCQLEYLLFLIVVVVVVMMVVVGEDLDHQHRTKPNHHSQLTRRRMTRMRISRVDKTRKEEKEIMRMQRMIVLMTMKVNVDDKWL